MLVSVSLPAFSEATKATSNCDLVRAPTGNGFSGASFFRRGVETRSDLRKKTESKKVKEDQLLNLFIMQHGKVVALPVFILIHLHRQGGAGGR